MRHLNNNFKFNYFNVVCDEKLPNFEPEKLEELVSSTLNQFFKDFGLKSTKTQKPLNLYLFRTDVNCKNFQNKNKNELSAWCLDRQCDYVFFAKIVVKKFLYELIAQKFSISQDDFVLMGIANYYMNKLTFKNNSNYLERRFFINTVFNETSKKMKKFYQKSEATLVAKYFIENGKAKELFKPNVIYENKDNVKQHYYKTYGVGEIPKIYEQVETVEELLDFLDKEVVYGSFYKTGETDFFCENWKQTRKLGISQTPNQSIKNHVATCADQALIVNDFLKQKGYETKIFFVANYQHPLDKKSFYEGLDTLHYRVFYKDTNGWTQVESLNYNFRGQHHHKTLSEGLTKGFADYFYWNNFELFELTDIKTNATFVELYDEAKKGKQIKVLGSTIKDFKVCYEENSVKKKVEDLEKRYKHL